MSSLLNKLCTQYYDISPLEFDQKRCVNPGYIKKLQINKTWFLSQLRKKCTNKETVQLLSRLSYEELISFLKSGDFCKVLFKECLRLGLNSVGTSESPLIRASVECLLDEVKKICDRIPQPHQVVVFLVKIGHNNAIVVGLQCPRTRRVHFGSRIFVKVVSALPRLHLHRLTLRNHPLDKFLCRIPTSPTSTF